ncbi:hypothetical protein WG907_04180 [Sphingobium sp. AN558]|uniref:hypothetical protein n=1 Tax=Sphingobium sp. AN558 TaxID=3133442 RepID=UPI0030BE01D7
MSEAAIASPLVGLCYLVAGCLFLAALLRSMAPAPSPIAGRIGLAGLMLSLATTVCTLDALSLPEMIGTMLAGGGIGWLAARRTGRGGLVPLMLWLQGLVGLAVLLFGVALGLDPDAFGIVPGFPGRVGIAVCVGLGAIGATGVVVLLLKGRHTPPGKRLTLPSLCSGAGAVAGGLLLENWVMILAGVMAIAFLSAMIARPGKVAGRACPSSLPSPTAAGSAGGATP